MPDDDTTSATPTPAPNQPQADPGTGGQKPESEFKPIASQAELDQRLAGRLERERAKFADYEELKRKAKEFDKHDQANKTGLQKAQDQLTAEKEAREKAEGKLRQAERTQFGIDKGLPLALAKRLTGEDDEALTAEVNELLPLVGGPGPKPNPQQGQPSKQRASGIAAGGELYKQLNPATT